MSDNNEIFEGKTFQDLTKDIYENTTKRKVQIDLLISEIHGFITTIDDVVMVAPIIKEYMDTAVKNDEHLVKLAGVLQRIISKSSGGDDESMLLSEAEKDELMGTLQDTVNDLQNDTDKIKEIKNKKIGGNA
jgi:hypothetical protein